MTLFRKLMTPAIMGDASGLAKTPEVAGIDYAASDYRTDVKGAKHSETVDLYVPTRVAVGFANGDLTEQQMLDQSVAMHSAGAISVRMNITVGDTTD